MYYLNFFDVDVVVETITIIFKSFIVPFHCTLKQHYIIHSYAVVVETIAIIFILAAVVVEIVVIMWLFLIHFTYL
jgi:hypothetical protein